ncbi:MAG: PrsW family intramembrane metalloprotease [Actinobacteria bacterium]|nr:PrsW family intramembrane metalloprotease [Actinomycetota bacterium]
MSEQTATQDRTEAIDAAGWGSPVVIWQPHNPAFWLYVGALVLGVFQFATQVVNFSDQLMPAMVSSTILWSLYVLPWAWFIHHKDRFGRETRRLAVIGFVWGGLIATFLMALPGNAAMLSIMSKLFDSQFALAWGPAIVAPLVEESSKGVGVVMLILLASRHVRTSYDGFILGAFVGLGFQVFEDWMYGVGASGTAFGFDQVHNSITTFLGRGLLAGLVSHALYTALVGAGIGAWVQSRGKPLGARLPGAVGPIAASLLLHGIWDYAAFSGIQFLGLLTGISAVILVVMIGRWTNRQLRPWMSDLLAPEVATGLITDDELTAMVGSPRDRRHLVHAAKREHGDDAGKATRHVLHAELDLAEALGHSAGADSDDVAHARSELQRLRAALEVTLNA